MNNTLLLAHILLVPCSIGAIKGGVTKDGNSQPANKYNGLLYTGIEFEMDSELTAKVMEKASIVGALTNEGETKPW
jgi:hypothetical protein